MKTRKWRAAADAARLASKETATNVIQLHPTDIPDFDENESDDQIRQKLATRFQVVKQMTEDALDNLSSGLILSGPPGVGKSHDVLETLKKRDPEGGIFKVTKGYVKATGLYRLLYKRRFPGNVTVFDDADSIYTDETSLQFLKIATDTVDQRVLTYGAEFDMYDEEEGANIPREFEFEGSVIFITNIDFDVQIARGTKLAPHLEAMTSRANYIDLGMKTKRDYLIRIFDVVNESGMLAKIGLDDVQQAEVLTFIDDHSKNLRELSLRMALKLGKLRLADHPDRIGWREVAKITCCRGLA